MGKLKKKWDGIPITVKVATAYAVSSILQRCLSFITLPLFTRLLTTEQYGQFTVYQSWTGIFSIFLTLNLAYGSFSTAMVRFEEDRDGYISAVEGISLALAMLFMAVYLPFREQWNRLFELPTLFVCIMAAEVLGANAIQLWSGKKRFEFKYKSVVGLTMGMTLLSPTLAYFLVIGSSEKGYARILGYALVSILVGWSVFILNAVRGRKLLNRKYWKYALSFNIPLLVYYLSQVIFNQSDRIMISHMVGTDKAAVYGVAYNLATVLTFMLNAINNSYVPWFYGRIKEGKMRENRTVSLGIAALMALMLLAVIWFAPELIGILAGEKYREAVYVIPPVAISLLLLFYSQLFINVEFFYEEKKKLIGASVGAAVTNLVLNYICIRRFGFVAAAYTTLFSYIIFAAANNRAMKRLLKDLEIPDEGFNYKGLIGLLIAFAAVAYGGVAMYGALLPRLAITLAVLTVLFVKRRTLLDFYKRLKQ